MRLFLLTVLALVFATPVLAEDLTGAYALEGSSSNFAYSGTVTLVRLGAWSLPTGQEAETYDVAWLYQSGHKDTGIGVHLGDRLYVAWSPTPLVELFVVMPLDTLPPALVPLRKATHDRIAYGFRRDGLGKLLTLGGAKGSPKGDYAFGGIALAPEGTRRGTTTTEGVLSIDARPAGLVFTGKGTHHLPEAHPFAMEGAGMALKNGWFVFSWTAPGRDPNGIGEFAIDGNRLSGEMYNRMRLYRAYETLTKK